MKPTTQTTNSQSSAMSPLTQQFISEGAILNAVMEFTAYECGWGPVPSGTSMAILAAEQRGVAYAPSRTAIVHPHTIAQERQKARKCNAPTLRVVIPSSTPGASSPVPTIEVIPPTPITPRSPIHPSYTEEEAAYTPTTYYNLARRVPLTQRVPDLPQYCPHTVRPRVRARTSDCTLCATQLLACDTWFSWSSASMNQLRVPAVLPSMCDVETRSIYYALGIPLGELDRSCIDQDIVDSIVFSRRTALVCRSNKKTAVRGSSRMRTLVRRAGHVLSAPLRAPVFAAPR